MEQYEVSETVTVADPVLVGNRIVVVRSTIESYPRQVPFQAILDATECDDGDVNVDFCGYADSADASEHGEVAARLAAAKGVARDLRRIGIEVTGLED